MNAFKQAYIANQHKTLFIERCGSINTLLASLINNMYKAY